MMRISLLIVYNIFLISAALLLVPVIAIAMLIQPKFRAGFFKKIGFYKSAKECNKSTVFHAVSVGETNAIKELIKEYRKIHPDEYIVLTTTTKTGQEIAKKSLNEVVNKITYFPFDFFFSVTAFFHTYKPEKIIIAETEIWPCFVIIAKLMNIKVYTINGRISPHSFNGYKKISFLLAPIFKCYEQIFMQSQADSDRMKEIGAESDKVSVMGNLKFDISKNLSKEEITAFQNELKLSDFRLFIAGSTHKGEDEIVIDSFKKLKKCQNDAKLLLVPRHPQRYDEVCELLNKSGLKWGKRSLKDDFSANEVILLDTMGELSKLYSVCYLAFIGGSFVQTGGHNPLEANIWNKPVLSGSVIFNFKDVYKTVCEKNCAVIVNNGEELTDELISFYSDNDKYKKYCDNAKSVFEENSGAVQYVLERI